VDIYVYTNVKETATTGFIAMSMENPVVELDDFDRLVARVFCDSCSFP
jgi:hypothetical protein